MKKKILKQNLITESCSVFHLFSHLCFFRFTSHHFYTVYRTYTLNFFWLRHFFAISFSWVNVVQMKLIWAADPIHIICYNVCPTLNCLQLFVICSFVSLLQNVKDLACYAWCSMLTNASTANSFLIMFFFMILLFISILICSEHWSSRTIYTI